MFHSRLDGATNGRGDTSVECLRSSRLGNRVRDAWRGQLRNK